MNHFWNISGSELRLEGTIASESWWGDEVTPAAFREELNAIKGDVTVYINSPGGDVFAASQIYTALMEHKGGVTVKIDGVAASAASVIAMAGDKVLMAPTAYMMIHNPLTAVYGNREDLKAAIKVLEEIKEGLVNAYEIKTGLSREKIANLMDAETWMNAQSARELGFCDGIILDKCGEDEDGKKDAVAAAMDGRCVYAASATLSDALVQRIAENLKPKQVEESEECKALREKLRRLADSIKE